MLVSGQIALVGLFDWLQVLELNRRTVLMRLRRRGERGSLRLVRGRIVEARARTAVGDAAARELLTWTDAHFEEERSLDESPGNVERSNYDLLLDAMDEAPAPPPLDPAWRVSGDILVTPVLELLQLGELNRRPLALRLAGDVDGHVLFDGGRIVAARTDEAADEEAVYALLTMVLGSFEVAPLAETPDGAFAADVQELLVEGVRRADEARLLRGESLPDPDPTETQLLKELKAGTLSPRVRLAMARRYQPRGEVTPVPALLRLAEDELPEVRTAALVSIDRLPLKVRQTLVGDPETPPAIRERVARALAGRPHQDEDLPDDHDYPRGIHGRIQNLPQADKIYLARRGTRNERLILMRHPNRRVALAALESSRTTEFDVEIIAGASSANPEVLGAIAHDPRYNARYSVVRSLVFNPKTPGTDAVKLVPRLREGDLRTAWRESDLSEPVRAAVRKRLRAIDVKRRF